MSTIERLQRVSHACQSLDGALRRWVARAGVDLQRKRTRCPHCDVEIVSGVWTNHATACPSRRWQFTPTDGKRTGGAFTRRMIDLQEHDDIAELERKLSTARERVARRLGITGDDGSAGPRFGDPGDPQGSRAFQDASDGHAREIRVLTRALELTADKLAAVKERLHVKRELHRASVAGILGTVGGTVDGHPTTEHNYLHRLRELVRNEEQADAILRATYEKIDAESEGADYYLWQGDGTDNLATIGNGSNVQITGAQLREVIADAADIAESTWTWRGDGHDNLEAFPHKCTVQITGAQLRILVSKARAEGSRGSRG